MAQTTLIEVRVGELRQLFDAIDPSPFHEKDLDPKAEDFIVSWSKEAHRDAPLALLVHLDGPPAPAQSEAMLGDAVHQFFDRRALAYRRRLKDLFRRGRISLAIGLAFLAAAVGISDLVALWMKGSGLGEVLRQSFAIGGWVAMWRPLEIFLYDWWPIRAEVRLSERLAAMPVRIRSSQP